MTMHEALEAMSRGETTEQYKARVNRLRRLHDERYDLEDAIQVLQENPSPDMEERAKELERLAKKVNRLRKVLDEIKKLQ